MTNGPPGFAALGLEPALVSALAALGYEEPTPIQREAIPPLLEGRDLLGQAATGHRQDGGLRPADPAARRHGRSRAESPPRARARADARARHAGRRGAAPLRPGEARERAPDLRRPAIGQQLRALQRGVEVVVATPGRALDHIERGTLELDGVRMRRARRGRRDARHGLRRGPRRDPRSARREQRQTALFSATMPPRIVSIARAAPARPGPHRDRARAARRRARRRACGRSPTSWRAPTSTPRSGACSTSRSPTSAIVFCRTRLEVDELTEALNARGYRAEALHGGIAQEQRDRVMKRFRSNSSDLLDRHRRRGARPRHRARQPRHQLRRPDRARRLRAPHRPHRARRTRGRRDHASSSRASIACCATSSSRRSRRSPSARSRP